MNIGEKFYSGLKYSFGSVFLGSVLYTKFVSSDPYTQVYQKSLRIFVKFIFHISYINFYNFLITWSKAKRKNKKLHSN